MKKIFIIEIVLVIVVFICSLFDNTVFIKEKYEHVSYKKTTLLKENDNYYYVVSSGKRYTTNNNVQNNNSITDEASQYLDSVTYKEEKSFNIKSVEWDKVVIEKDGKEEVYKYGKGYGYSGDIEINGCGFASISFHRGIISKIFVVLVILYILSVIIYKIYKIRKSDKNG